MKQFLKALHKEKECFKYICKSFPKVSLEKLKAGTLYCPQIRKLINNFNFLNATTVLKNFLGSDKAEHYEEPVRNMLGNFKRMGANMSIELHFLHNHIFSKKALS
ncbi:hypothetical protein AMK59_5683 [Oryctes borbonicus]|uniref:Uncharacterized protein n=1 Tax=Oryctes borbonicus TaxID=1629725 RepID=A0A0T6B3P6_9SCAR|nr:hypothetical protein AMK59_5683 [Oryctes borbonicus]